MMTTAFLALALIAATSALHFEALTWFTWLFQEAASHTRGMILLLILLLPVVHMLEIALYALAYYLLTKIPNLGSFTGVFRGTFMNYLYFSAETFTTLGYGDIIPRGDIRLLSCVEALNGLLLIGWSGAFVFLVMQRYWKLDAARWGGF